MQILCLTPIKHLNEVYEYLDSFGYVDYYPNLNKESVKGLIDSFDYDVIFCNPNKQNYLLDEYILTIMPKK